MPQPPIRFGSELFVVRFLVCCSFFCLFVFCLFWLGVRGEGGGDDEEEEERVGGEDGEGGLV